MIAKNKHINEPQICCLHSPLRSKSVQMIWTKLTHVNSCHSTRSSVPESGFVNGLKVSECYWASRVCLFSNVLWRIFVIYRPIFNLDSLLPANICLGQDLCWFVLISWLFFNLIVFPVLNQRITGLRISINCRNLPPEMSVIKSRFAIKEGPKNKWTNNYFKIILWSQPWNRTYVHYNALNI